MLDIGSVVDSFSTFIPSLAVLSHCISETSTCQVEVQLTLVLKIVLVQSAVAVYGLLVLELSCAAVSAQEACALSHVHV